MKHLQSQQRPWHAAALLLVVLSCIALIVGLVPSDPPSDGRLVLTVSEDPPPAELAASRTETRRPDRPQPDTALCAARVLDSQHRGMAFAHSTRHGGYGTEASAASLGELADIGVDWISITPFGWQSAVDDPVVTVRSDRGESDTRLRAVTAQARELGMQVVMKPHLWLRRGGWRGDIGFDSEAEWQRWFDSYTDFVRHYAALSEALGIELFVVGVELASSTTTHAEAWREVIAEVRAVYSGPIVYAANWDEVARVTFWDAVDYIGVQMFAPLSALDDPTFEELVVSSQSHLDHFREVASRYRRPLLLTEVGYRAVRGTTVRPWDWPTRGDSTPASEADQRAQAAAYCAIVSTFGQDESVAGMYWWKWFSNIEARSEGPTGFSPRAKLAEDVLRTAFARD